MIIDLFFVVIAVGGFLYGFDKGIIHVILSRLAFVFALLIAILLTPYVAMIIKRVVAGDSPIVPLLAFGLTLVAAYFGMQAGASAFERMLKIAHINTVNRLVGGFTYTAVGLFILSGFTIFLHDVKFIPDSQVSSSHSYGFLDRYPKECGRVMAVASPYVAVMFERGTRTFMDAFRIAYTPDSKSTTPPTAAPIVAPEKPDPTKNPVLPPMARPTDTPENTAPKADAGSVNPSMYNHPTQPRNIAPPNPSRLPR